jgi:hypothetical protein
MSHIASSAQAVSRTRHRRQIHRARVTLSKAGQAPVSGVPEAEQMARDVAVFEEASRGINLLQRAKAWLRKALGK